MNYEITKDTVETTKWPRFGIGSTTESLYFQSSPEDTWISMETSFHNCGYMADIKPLAPGTSITFTQD